MRQVITVFVLLAVLFALTYIATGLAVNYVMRDFTPPQRGYVAL